ncbi:hypothetical protein FR932_10085 [Moritella marina ATCC 15381]|uniref:Uncharacterized protein n=1 Tax=Moritella marina ATCC 15381 TaxID=1202962 RepID=A0A5J6WLN5_MORMI|nr:hypothetical protein [Moritella marina]QFI38168.1 hypothetical protein FR932_10085 [Moritella marina ATCC 15381]
MIHLAKINSDEINSGLKKTYTSTYFISYIKDFCRSPLTLNSYLLYRGCRNAILITTLFSSLSVRAESVDDDKQKHFIAETVICGATMMYTESWWQTMLVGFTVGALKETYDGSQEGNKFDKNDMAANMLGCLAGLSYGATVLHFHYESETDTTTIGVEGKF